MPNTGPAGQDGHDGMDGQDGQDGQTGAAGVAGQTGATGATGVAGVAGQTGATGQTGITGQTGATGQVGVAGRRGAVGMPGDPGETGETGRAGAIGPPGRSGDAASLGVSLSALLAESQALREDVTANERARLLAVRQGRRVSQANTVIIGLLVLFVGLIGVITWQNNKLAHEVKAGNDRIADCTTAGGTCYDRGTARTGTAIADIVRASIFVAECARLWPGESGPAFDVKMETCVAEKLAAARQPRPEPSATIS